MLVELGLVEQRHQAVLEVLNDGASVTDVARRYGVARETVHEWLRRYAVEGLRGLADRSSKSRLGPSSRPGLNNCEIAAALSILHRTVECHVDLAGNPAIGSRGSREPTS